MSEFFSSLIPSYFELWHLPVVFLAGLVGEGYAVVIGSGGILIQFALAALGLPLPVVIATDIAGCLGSNAGVIAATPRSIWNNRKLLLMLGIPALLGGIVGTIFLIKISITILTYVLIVALIGLLSYMMFARKFEPQTPESLQIGLKQYPLVSGIMFGLGVHGNISGVGTGTFEKIAFTSLLRLKVADGIGISYIIDLPTTIFSLVVTAIAGLISWPYLLTLWVGNFIGSHYVAKHIRKIPDGYLRILLMIITVCYLVYLISSTI